MRPRDPYLAVVSSLVLSATTIARCGAAVGSHGPPTRTRRLRRSTIFLIACLALTVEACSVNGVRAPLGARDSTVNAIVRAHLAPNACGWVPQSSATIVAGNAFLTSVAAKSMTNVWTVGYTLAKNSIVWTPVSEHWNGTSWSMPAPAIPTGSSSTYLEGVAPLSPTQEWAAGYWRSGSVDDTLTEKWTGTAWQIVPSPDVNKGVSTNALNGIAAWGATSAWAVGDYDFTTNAKTLAMQRSGSSWVISHTPNPSATQNVLSAVAGVSPTDVWAVGYKAKGSDLLPLSMHWNGTTWTSVAVPVPNGMIFTELFGVDAIATNDVWAVGTAQGSAGAQLTLTEHWDGTKWRILSSPSVTGANSNQLNAVSSAGTDDVWAVGNYENASGDYFTLALNWNGSKWSIAATANPSSSENTFFGISAVDANDIWAVGNQSYSSTMVQAYCR